MARIVAVSLILFSHFTISKLFGLCRGGVVSWWVNSKISFKTFFGGSDDQSHDGGFSMDVHSFITDVLDLNVAS